MKKRYLLFGFDHYYPDGGMNDLLFGFDTLTEFDDAFGDGCDCYNVFDTETGESSPGHLNGKGVRNYVLILTT